MATAAGAGERSVSIGRVFARAFRTIAGNPLATLAIAFLFGALPSSALGYAFITYGMGFGGTDPWALIAATLAYSLATFAFTTIAQGGLVRLVVVDSEGGKASFGDSVGASLAVAPALFAMALLSSAGILVGLVFLIVPGLWLLVSWSVAASALVEERLGPTAALERSASLVNGARWKVAALLLATLGATWLGSFVLERLSIAGYANLAEAALAVPSPSALAHFAVFAAYDTLALAVWGVLQTSLYVELRLWKEGPATETLADIFG